MSFEYHEPLTFAFDLNVIPRSIIFTDSCFISLNTTNGLWITDFNPIIQHNIKPTDHVAVVGIWGLGHMAIKFLNSWGCEVTAISSNPEKERDTTVWSSSFLEFTGS